MTGKTKGFLLALDMVILAVGFAMLLPPLPAAGLFVIVGVGLAVLLFRASD